MKYIRTKDGVHLNKYPNQIDKRGCLYKITCKIPFSTVEYGKVIKQADTIEELCDVIIYTDKYGNHEIIYGSLEQKKARIEEIIKMGLKQGDVFYGAIWTDKGLIYVAKMNEKGDLELL